MVGAVLALSARGNFLRNGVYTSQQPVARLSLVAVFILGLCMLLEGLFSFSERMSYGGYRYGNQVEYAISKGRELSVQAVRKRRAKLTRVEDAEGNDLRIKREILPSYQNNLPRAIELNGSDYYPGAIGYRDVNRYLAGSL